MASLPVSPTALRSLLKEVEASASHERPLVVGGARELAAVLRRELGRGAAAGAVREGDAPEGAAVVVHVLGREPSAEDAKALRRAHRAAPVVAVVVAPGEGIPYVPHVLAADVVRVRPGEGFPLEAIGASVAARLAEDAAPLAARIPALRGPVCDHLVGLFARKAAVQTVLGRAAGADLPLLVLTQARLVLRLAQAQGRPSGRDRLPEVAAALGAAYGWRGAARELLVRLPGAKWAVQGAVAYAGTRTLGEAAVVRFGIGSPGGH
jgi:uncharacterized protein (DUF697 family)